MTAGELKLSVLLATLVKFVPHAGEVKFDTLIEE
jgi:hypothetical protein